MALSAFLARALCRSDYKAQLHIDWLPHIEKSDLTQQINASSSQNLEQLGKKYSFSRRLWHALIDEGLPDVDKKKSLAQLSGQHKNQLQAILKNSTYSIDGKSTFKEEFVTSGGLDLKEVDMRTMQSKKIPGLYLSGEILNIDGVTGGFNFQAAWTTAWHAGQALSKDLS